MILVKVQLLDKYFLSPFLAIFAFIKKFAPECDLKNVPTIALNELSFSFLSPLEIVCSWTIAGKGLDNRLQRGPEL